MGKASLAAHRQPDRHLSIQLRRQRQHRCRQSAAGSPTNSQALAALTRQAAATLNRSGSGVRCEKHCSSRWSSRSHSCEAGCWASMVALAGEVDVGGSLQAGQKNGTRRASGGGSGGGGMEGGARAVGLMWTWRCCAATAGGAGAPQQRQRAWNAEFGALGRSGRLQLTPGNLGVHLLLVYRLGLIAQALRGPGDHRAPSWAVPQSQGCFPPLQHALLSCKGALQRQHKPPCPKCRTGVCENTLPAPPPLRSRTAAAIEAHQSNQKWSFQGGQALSTLSWPLARPGRTKPAVTWGRRGQPALETSTR